MMTARRRYPPPQSNTDAGAGTSMDILAGYLVAIVVGALAGLVFWAWLLSGVPGVAG